MRCRAPDRASVYGVTLTDREKAFMPVEVLGTKKAQELEARLYFPGRVALAKTLSKGTWLNAWLNRKDT